MLNYTTESDDSVAGPSNAIEGIDDLLSDLKTGLKNRRNSNKTSIYPRKNPSSPFRKSPATPSPLSDGDMILTEVFKKMSFSNSSKIAETSDDEMLPKNFKAQVSKTSLSHALQMRQSSTAEEDSEVISLLPSDNTMVSPSGWLASSSGDTLKNSVRSKLALTELLDELNEAPESGLYCWNPEWLSQNFDDQGYMRLRLALFTILSQHPNYPLLPPQNLVNLKNYSLHK